MLILEQHTKLPVFLLGLLLAFISISCAGIHQKVARVNVSEKDMQHASEAFMEGNLAFNRKDHYGALIKYLEAVRYNPNNEGLYNRLGIAYAQLQYYSEAIKTLERATKLNPKFSYGFNTLGSVFFLQRKLGRAEKNFKKAIHLNSNEATFHINLGNLYLERKKPQKAVFEWRKALALDPLALTRSSAISLTGAGRTTPVERIYLLATLYASEKKVDLAIESLKRAIASGFSDIAAIEKNPDFDPIRQDPRFIEFAKNMPLLIGFRDKAGLPEGTPEPSPVK